MKLLLNTKSNSLSTFSQTLFSYMYSSWNEQKAVINSGSSQVV